MTRRVSFQLEHEFGSPKFNDLGRPAGAFSHPDGRLVALCSEFDPLWWPARACYTGHRLRYRLSLYDLGTGERTALFDRARFPINDVAFHPTLPLAVIATGSYDGGWSFKGELLAWDWKTGESRSLLGESREVARCRFLDEARVSFLLRPANEEQFLGENAFEVYLAHSIEDVRRAFEPGEPDLLHGGDDLHPVKPAAMGFEDQGERGTRNHFLLTLGPWAKSFEERHRVWDVLWLDPSNLLAVDDTCSCEAWSLDGTRTARIEGEGHGVQILRSRDRTLVHVLQRGTNLEVGKDRSSLHVFQGNGLRKIQSFDGAYLFSADAHGRILARDTRNPMHRDRKPADLVLDSEGRILSKSDLGHYDCFNHYIRLEGRESLFYLRGNPKSSHEQKWLCAIDANGQTRDIMPWDRTERHLMEGSATWATPDSIVVSFHSHDPSPTTLESHLARWSLKTGRATWSVTVESVATAMKTVPELSCVVVALADGRIGAVSTEDGHVLELSPLIANGIPTVGLSLDVLGPRVVVGTIDGRLLVYALSAIGPAPASRTQPS